jgi:hypothetical protein
MGSGPPDPAFLPVVFSLPFFFPPTDWEKEGVIGVFDFEGVSAEGVSTRVSL